MKVLNNVDIELLMNYFVQRGVHTYIMYVR